MNELTNYSKVAFKSVKEAKAKLEPIQSFYREGIKACNYWEGHRKKEPTEFWPEFKKQFPLVYKYLDLPKTKATVNNKCDCNNALAGRLDFGEEDTIEMMCANGNQIWYSATVWYFADWTPLMKFIEKEFGAVATGWVSDEDIDYFDLIDMQKSGRARGV